jgi:hypothetical protein
MAALVIGKKLLSKIGRFQMAYHAAEREVIAMDETF